MPYVHSSLIPYAYVAQTFSLRSTDAQTKSLCYKVRLETTSTVVIRVKDKALRTSYFLYRAHVIIHHKRQFKERTWLIFSSFALFEMLIQKGAVRKPHR